MLWTRLYHPQWLSVVFNAILATAAMFAPLVLMVVPPLLGNTTAAMIAATGGLFYLAGLLMLVFLIERAIRKLLRNRGESLPNFTASMLMKILFAVPLTQALYMASVIQCTFMRQVDWRGVKYQIDGPWNVRMIDYQPMAEVAEENVSI
jgi:hypothetical protein